MLPKHNSTEILYSHGYSEESLANSMENSSHVRRYRFVTFIAFFSYAASVAFASLSAFGMAPFVSTPGAQSDKYSLGITPAGFTFSIWGIIYITLGLSHIFLIFIAMKHPLICRFVASTSTLMMLSLSYGGQIAWLILFDREQISISCVVLVLTAITAVVPVYKIAETISYLDSEEWPIRRRWSIFCKVINNCFAIYAAWVTCASVLNLGIAFQYKGEMDPDFVDIVCLSIILLITTLYSIRILAGQAKRSEFFSIVNIITPSLVFVWALVGIFLGNELIIPGAESILVFVGMGIQGMTALGQVVTILACMCKNDKSQPRSGNPLDSEVMIV